GNSAYQNLFWLPLAFLRTRIAVASTAVALLLSWLVLAVSPGAMREVLTGGDLLANSLWVPLLMMAVLVTARTGRARLARLEVAARRSSIALARRAMDAFGGRAMAACATVQAFVIVAAVLLASVQAHAVDFTFLISSYGLTALGFAVFATATALRATESLRP